MCQCWDGDPYKRPHVGMLELSLRRIYERFLASSSAALPTNGDVQSAGNNDLDMTTSYFWQNPDHDLTLQ